jgi:uncharacterized protein
MRIVALRIHDSFGMSETPPPLRGPAPRGVRRWPWLLLAYLCLALAVLGVLLPVLPTTPFVLVAAWAAARGSRRLHDWLQAHRLFGPMIRDWQREGAVSRRAKQVALISMLVCALIMLRVSPSLWLAAFGCGVMTVVGVWLWLRPEPGSTAD